MIQLAYDAFLALERARYSPSALRRLAARVLMRLLRPWTRVLASTRALVTASVHGRTLWLTTDHLLPVHLAYCPHFGEPLALLVQAVERRPVRIIDVGANIGSTVALIEQAAPGRGVYLCVEPDAEYAKLFRRNLNGFSAARLEGCFVSDRAGQPLQSLRHSPGTAAAVAGAPGGGTPTRTLDDLAAPFVREHGGLDVLKIDTDGFDFKVLRSAAGLLRQHRPAIFFELHPALWDLAGEDPSGVVPYLTRMGYEDFVFFSHLGPVHARLSAPDSGAIAVLVETARARRALDDFHYDVLCAPRALADRVVEESLARLARRSGHPSWPPARTAPNATASSSRPEARSAEDRAQTREGSTGTVSIV